MLTAKRKAFSINQDHNIYGTFAEIGAGQEVVRHFFRAGGASGTIAKAMSAYDKDFSDAIYGKEDTGQYVCKSRLIKMLQHEYTLMKERLDRHKHPEKKFFAFADTLTTINYERTNHGHGWMGIRYQSHPDGPPNDVILHLRMHDQEAALQQEAVGLVGVNLIFSCFNFYKEPNEALHSLYDNVEKHRIEIDMIWLEGPDFAHIDNRLMSLQLVRNGMTQAVMFGPDGRNLHPSEALYKKNILAMRGSFRPVTNVNMDMLKNGYAQFTSEKRVDKDNVLTLFEITLSNLKADGEIDEKDFLDRADLLCSLGQTVLISSFEKYYKLVDYFSRYTKNRMGLLIGVNSLLDIFDESYYRDLNGGILEAFGVLFTRDLKMYLHPYRPSGDEVLYTRENAKIPPRLKPLYDYLLQTNRIIDLKGFNESYLHIFSKKIVKMIHNGEAGWEEMVPGEVDSIIKEKGLFSFGKG